MCVARTIPPATGTAPPVLPVPPARGVTGTPHRSAISSVAATSSALSAITTMSGARPVTSLSSVMYGAHASGDVATFDVPSRRSSSIFARSTDAFDGSGTSGTSISTTAF